MLINQRGGTRREGVAKTFRDLHARSHYPSSHHLKRSPLIWVISLPSPRALPLFPNIYPPASWADHLASSGSARSGRSNTSAPSRLCTTAITIFMVVDHVIISSRSLQRYDIMLETIAYQNSVECVLLHIAISATSGQRHRLPRRDTAATIMPDTCNTGFGL
jgi:hypothetical protein